MTSPAWIRLGLGVVTLVAVTSCGGGEQDVTLSVVDVTWEDPQTLLLTTECATEVRVEVGPDAGGSEVSQLSVFGDPQVGRCVPEVRVPIPPGTTKVIDAATSKVIELSPPG